MLRIANALRDIFRCEQRAESARYLRPFNGTLWSVCAGLAMLGLSATPTNAAEVGHTPGEFSVDPTGAANYRIPIIVPPGVAGMQAELALIYSSRAGNGQIGVGWSLAGLTVITRCGSTMAQDGIVRGVMLGSQDKFCLDGQRLMAVSGTYGADGTQYRTEIESFQRITSHGTAGTGPAWFKVEDKTGLIREYGNTTGSRIEAQGKSTASLWLINRIEDRFGNYIEFQHGEDTGATGLGEYWPSKVQVRNRDGVLINEVQFNFSNGRSDKTYGYSYGGSRASMTRRLSSIEVRSQGALVRKYNLAYIAGVHSGLSHLASVTECDSANACLPPTTFTYEQGEKGFYTQETGRLPGDREDLQYGDVDNDGLPDAVFASGGLLSTTYRIIFGDNLAVQHDTAVLALGRRLDKAVTLDYDGDGRTDFLVANTSTGNWDLLQSNGSTLILQSNIKPHFGSWDKYPIAVDIDGDALPELIYKNSGRIHFYRNSANGFSAAPVDTGLVVTDRQVLTPLEFNGDGLPDIAVNWDGCSIGGGGGGGGGGDPDPPQFPKGVDEPLLAETASTCQQTGGILINNGTTLIDGPAGPTDEIGGDNGQAKLLDVNGDGLTDLAYPVTPLQKWSLYINKGGRWELIWDGFNDQNYARAQVFDYNGDGRQDLIVPQGSVWYALTWNGPSFSATIVNTGISSLGQAFLFMDYSGDALADMVYHNGSDWVIRAHKGAAKGMLTDIQNGLGDETRIQYGSIADPNQGTELYEGSTQDGLAGLPVQFPVRHFSEPLYVVRKFAADTGVISGGGELMVYTDYRYAGAKLHQWGRGFLGFSRIESHNMNKAVVATNYHRQDYPYIGMVENAQRSLPDIPSATGVRDNDIDDEFEPCTPGATHCSDPLSIVGPDPVASAMSGTVTMNSTAAPGDLISDTTHELASQTFGSGQSARKLPYIRQTTDLQYKLKNSNAVVRRTVTDYVYDVLGNPTSIVVATDNGFGGDRHSISTTNTYTNDTAKWCLGRLTQASVTHRRAAYATNNNASVSSTRNSSFGYDPVRCHLTTETIEANTAHALTKTYGFDVFGNRISETTSGAGLDSRTTTTAYDSVGQFPVSVTNALGHTGTRVWDHKHGVPLSIIGPNQLTSSFEYDSFGRKTRENTPLAAAFTTWSYAWCGASCNSGNAVYRIIAHGSDGSHSTEEFDQLGRSVHTTQRSPNGSDVHLTTHYDPVGRPYATSIPYFSGQSVCWTFRKYDNLDRIVSEYAPANELECSGTQPPPHNMPPGAYSRISNYAYDGLTVTAIDPEGRAGVRINNVMDRLRFVCEGTSCSAASVKTEYDYGPFGNTAWVRDAAANETHLSYDIRGFKIGMNDPDMGQWAYGYNAVGELTLQTDAKGQQLSQVYDDLGRLIERHEPEGQSTWTYDTAIGAGIGKLASVVGPDGNGESYVYDGYGRLTDTLRVIDGEGYLTTQTYDSLGRPDLLLYPDRVHATAVPRSPPATPSAINVPSASDTGSYTVSWSIDAEATYYDLRESTNQTTWNSVSSPSSNSYTLNGKPNGTYYYRVAACNGGGCSDFLTGANGIVVDVPPQAPGAPASLTVPSGTNTTGAYSINWSAASGVVTAYELGQQRDGGAWAQIYAGLNQGNGLTGQTDGAYAYRVRACNQTVCSNWVSGSNVVTVVRRPAVPGTPAVPSGTNTSGSYSVSWNSVTFANRYQLQEQVDGGSWSTVHDSGLTSRSLTGRADGDYLYRLRACNGASICSGWSGSSAITVVRQPGVPAAPTVPGVTNTSGSFAVSWAAVSFASRYQLQERLGSGSWVGVYDAGGTSTTRSGRTDGSYTYRARACNGASICSGWSGTSAAVSVIRRPAVPASITIPDSAPSGSYQVSWSAVANFVTRYEVHEDDNGSFSSPSTVHNASGTSLSVSGKSNGTYYYRVRACNGSVCSGFRSGSNGAVVLRVPGTPPSISSSPRWGNSPLTFTVSWGAASGSVGYYELYESNSNGQFAPATLRYSGPNRSRSFTRNTGSRLYRARACNAGGCSGYRTGGAVEILNGSGEDPLGTPPETTSQVEMPLSTLLPGAHRSVSYLPAPGVVSVAASAEQTGLNSGGSDIYIDPWGSETVTYAARVVGPEPPRPIPIVPLRNDPRVLNSYLAHGGILPARLQHQKASTQLSSNALAVQNVYGQYGRLVKVQEVNPDSTVGVVYWEAQSVDALGNVTSEDLGNGLNTVRSHNHATGVLDRITTGANAAVQNLEFTWDRSANLLQRVDHNSNHSEIFTYDALHRLATNTVSLNGAAGPTRQFQYDAVGNITRKDSFTNYLYGVGSAGPHAVTSVNTSAGARTYQYDANGNMVSVAGGNADRSVTWWSFNKPKRIEKTATVYSEFTYGPDRARYIQVAAGSMGINTTHYVGSVYERLVSGAQTNPATEHVHYIRAGGRVIATYKARSNNTDDTHYLHRDNLGSVHTITNEFGVIAESLNYGPWGKRRQAIDWSDLPIGDFLSGVTTPRGFAGHEHLDDIGLIHMNGRVYDPELGRFLSPDPFVQFPESTQGFNRYTYVNNNPLSLSDPSGYFIQLLAAIIVPALELEIGTAIAAMAVAGAVDGYIATGSLRGALQGAAFAAASAGIAHGIGELFNHQTFGFKQFGSLVGKSALHGISQGVLSQAGGGRFGDGFLSSFTSSFLGGPLSRIGAGEQGVSIKQVMVAAAVGGTASVVGGGKFANGAASAAFVNLFNEQWVADEEHDVPVGEDAMLSQDPVIQRIRSAEYSAAWSACSESSTICRISQSVEGPFTREQAERFNTNHEDLEFAVEVVAIALPVARLAQGAKWITGLTVGSGVALAEYRLNLIALPRVWPGDVIITTHSFHDVGAFGDKFSTAYLSSFRIHRDLTTD